jgi:hypothetical protein
MPASISLIRHAEKQLGDGPPYGVSADAPNSGSISAQQPALGLGELLVGLSTRIGPGRSRWCSAQTTTTTRISPSSDEDRRQHPAEYLAAKVDSV